MKKGEKMSLEQKKKISDSNKHRHNMTKAGRDALSKSHHGKSPSNTGKMCVSNLDKNLKIYILKEELDEYVRKGWIKGDYINKTSNSNWYNNPDNREMHRIRTSIGTKKALSNRKVFSKLKNKEHIERFLKVRRKNWHEMTKYEAAISEFLLERGFIYQKGHHINGKYYVSDFANDNLMIWIEIDGKSHTSDEAIYKDMLRDKNLTQYGYKVLRFKNKEIIDDIESVKTKILSVIQSEVV